MVSGKRRRVMIGCVTFETVKVSDPVVHYDTEHVHLIHYVRDPDSSSGKIYRDFYEETKSLILSQGERTIYEHNCDVNSFPEMMREVTDILTKEYREFPNSDIFVNISAGSSEYVAAATIVSMMFKDTICFAVRSQGYTVPIEKIPEFYYKDGKPVGLCEATYPPVIVPKINIPLPDEGLVRGLRIYVNSDHRARNVISELKKEGLWIRSEESSTQLERYDSVYYHRDFVSKWIEEGWVTKDKYRNRYNLTDAGRRVLATFYL